MNTKILMVLAVLMVLAYPVSAYDQSTPANYNINYQITTNTEFTVAVVAGQTALNFSTYKTATGAQPTGQNASASPPVPWATITNSPSSQMVQTFKAKLGAANPTGITTRVASDNAFSDLTTLSATSAQSPGGWYNVAVGNSVKAYFQIDTTGSAVSGTNTLIISAVP